MKRFIWNTYLDSLEKKYSLFYINRKYKDKSFKDEAEYVSVQRKVSDEIEALNKEIKKSIETIVHETYPEVEVLMYDSLPFSRGVSYIGKILTKGVRSTSETLDVKACFEKFSSVKITVERIEDLSEEDKESVEKLLSK